VGGGLDLEKSDWERGSALVLRFAKAEKAAEDNADWKDRCWKDPDKSTVG